MIWQRESEKAFPEIRDFYWRLIDDMASVNDRIGWKKGIYPSDDFLIESLKKGNSTVCGRMGLFWAQLF